MFVRRRASVVVQSISYLLSVYVNEHSTLQYVGETQQFVNGLNVALEEELVIEAKSNMTSRYLRFFRSHRLILRQRSC